MSPIGPGRKSNLSKITSKIINLYRSIHLRKMDQNIGRRSFSVLMENFDFSGDEYEFFFRVGDRVNTRCRTRLSSTRIFSETQEKSNRCSLFNLIPG